VLISYFTTASGVWGLAGSLAWSFAPTRRAMLAVLLATQPGYVLYWWLQNDWTAAGMTVLAILLTVLSVGLDGEPDSGRVRWTRRGFLLTLIPVAAITAFTWSGLSSFLAGIGLAMGCLARWQTDGGRFKALMFSSALPWLAHDLLTMAGSSICADVFAIGRGGWVLWREHAAARVVLGAPESQDALAAAA
jgi:hypothetical protein